jgi:hypothetical protein
VIQYRCLFAPDGVWLDERTPVSENTRFCSSRKHQARQCRNRYTEYKYWYRYSTDAISLDTGTGSKSEQRFEGGKRAPRQGRRVVTANAHYVLQQHITSYFLLAILNRRELSWKGTFEEHMKRAQTRAIRARTCWCHLWQQHALIHS